MDKCDLALLCPKSWDDLAPTEFEFSRFCGTCSKAVLICQTRLELAVASSLGRCVALAKDNEVIGWVGEPEGTWDWMEEPSERLAIRPSLPLSAAEFSQLKLLYPSALTTYSKPDDIATDTWIQLGCFTPFVASGILKELAEKLPRIQVLRGG